MRQLLGHCVFTNVLRKNAVILTNPNQETPLTGGDDGDDNHKWEFKVLSNGRFTISSSSHGGQFAWCGSNPQEKTSVVGCDKVQEWKIRKAPTPGAFLITTIDDHLCWTLPYHDSGTPIELSSGHRNKQCWWHIDWDRLETESTPDQSHKPSKYNERKRAEVEGQLQELIDWAAGRQEGSHGDTDPGSDSDTGDRFTRSPRRYRPDDNVDTDPGSDSDTGDRFTRSPRRYRPDDNVDTDPGSDSDTGHKLTRSPSSKSVEEIYEPQGEYGPARRYRPDNDVDTDPGSDLDAGDRFTRSPSSKSEIYEPQREYGPARRYRPDNDVDTDPGSDSDTGDRFTRSPRRYRPDNDVDTDPGSDSDPGDRFTHFPNSTAVEEGYESQGEYGPNMPDPGSDYEIPFQSLTLNKSGRKFRNSREKRRHQRQTRHGFIPGPPGFDQFPPGFDPLPLGFNPYPLEFNPSQDPPPFGMW